MSDGQPVLIPRAVVLKALEHHIAYRGTGVRTFTFVDHGALHYDKPDAEAKVQVWQLGPIGAMHAARAVLLAEAKRAEPGGDEVRLDALKFRALVSGLRRQGMGHLYEYLMGEQLPVEK
jgi:hypothetical protein